MFEAAGPASLRAALALADEFSREDEIPGFAHTTWLAMGLWRLAGQMALATAVESQLTRQIQDDMPASSLTWLLSTLRTARVSPRAGIVGLAVERLTAQQ